MTTVTAPTPTSKTTRKPAHGTCKLTLSISGTDYRLKPIPCEDFAELKAWRLRKADGTVYDVVEHGHGPECSCPDFVFARDGIDPAGCKHIKALVAVGLLSGPAPMVADEPRSVVAKLPQPITAPEPADEPKVEADRPQPSPATVDALDWAHAICGRLWEVATAEQRSFAVAIMNNDSGLYFQRRITPGGPSLEELRARLADRANGSTVEPLETATIAPAEGVNSTDTPEDVRSTDTPAPVEQTKTDEIISPVFSPAPCCDPAAELVPCEACAADGWPSTDEIDRFTWGIVGGLTGEEELGSTMEPISPEPASDEELEGFDPDDLTFREIPDSDDVPPDDEHPSDSDFAPRLSVAEWIRNEADRYAARGTAAADLIAETLHSLARGFDRVGASTVEQYKDRWAAIEADAR